MAKISKEDIIELAKQGYTQKEIGELLNCHEETIRRNCKKYGIKTSGNDKRRKDLKNKKSGEITFLEVAGIGTYRDIMWKCRCSCGNEIILSGKQYMKVLHCGCLKEESKTKSRIYKIWRGMKSRCSKEDTGTNSWEEYGGRGIRVCQEWDNEETGFENFKKWSYENGYEDTLTIDRIDVNKNYSPNNCKWATLKEQGRNKRNNRMIEYKGEVKCLSEWSDIFNIKSSTISKRIDKYKWSVDKALTTPVKKKG